MNRNGRLASLVAGALLAGALPVGAQRQPQPYVPQPVVWDTPSADARGSMPLGNGDIALNAWVDPAGDILFYVAKSDSWEENSRLAKVGLVRVRLDPPLLARGDWFRQELVTADGQMVVSVRRAATPDQPAVTTTVRLWVDANHPVAHVEIEGERPVAAFATFEPWRTVPTALPSVEGSDINIDRSKPNQQAAPTIVEPDLVLRDLADGIGWLHHNARSLGPVESMRQQDLLQAPWTDPILHRTFGAIVRAPLGGRRADDRRIEAAAAARHRFDVYVVTSHPASPDQWLASIRRVIRATEGVPFEARRRAHLAWWHQFWQRSHIVVSSAPGAPDPAAAADVTRGYTLQRYVTACAGRGAYPIKFNGSLFTVPWPGQPGDADYRKWGPGYWWQNTRLPYWPLTTSGDFDLLAPFQRMYAGDLLRVGQYRAKRYFGFDGAAYFSEEAYTWGAVTMDTYGRATTAAEREDKLQTAGWHKWEWVGGLEFAFMLLDCYSHTLDEAFLQRTVLPAALPLVRWFDRFYKAGADGKLSMHPAQSLETWWNVTNPMPEVAGLHAVIDRLLALSPSQLRREDREYLVGLKGRVPALPVREVDGVRILAPAERFEDKRNVENPELYAVFPFRLVAFEKPNVMLGLEALPRRTDRGPFGWRQEDIFMAYLGLADEARDYVVRRARSDAGADMRPEAFRMRFPAFWGPNYDWVPDQCHGGVLMKALQSMLLQTDGDRIFLLPAWPAGWDADFKLHAPRRTVVEGVVRGGKLVSLRVTPPSRRRDVVVRTGQP